MTLRRSNRRERRRSSVGAAIVLAAMLVAVAGLARASATQAASTVTTTVPVTADAYVNAGRPATNYGSATKLVTDASPMVVSYLSFDLSGISGTIAGAKLRLYSLTGTTVGLTVRSVSASNWGEMTITYDNAPAYLSDPSDPTSGSFTA